MSPTCVSNFKEEQISSIAWPSKGLKLYAVLY